MRMTHCAFPLVAVALAACGVASNGESTREDAAEVSVDTNATYQIVGLHSGKCIEVAGGSTSSLAQIQIATCNMDNRQQFRFEPMEGSYYRIRNVKSGLCAAVSGASTADGAKVIQETCGTGYDEQWSFTDVASSIERLTPRHSGKAMDVNAWGTNDGALVQQWTYGNQANQQFKLRVVGTPDAGGGVDSGGVDGGGVDGGGVDGGGGARSAGCGRPASMASGNYTIDVNGAQREYILDVPSNYDPNRAYRVVFGWHWRGGQASDVAVGNGYYGLKALANGSAIFVAPNGIDHGWANTGGRDEAFARALIDSFETNLCVDRARIFSAGFSFGGMMSDAIGCDMADVFRAIAPMSGALYSGCNKSSTHPIAVWMSHGTADDVVPIADARAALDVFVKKNGCSAATSPVDPSPCATYQGCKVGYPVTFCAFDGGHWWPGFAGTAIWNFFSQF